MPDDAMTNRSHRIDQCEPTRYPPLDREDAESIPVAQHPSALGDGSWRSETESDEVMRELLAGLDPGGPPRLAFARRAPGGIVGRAGQLLCLSASFNPLTVAHVWLIREASRIVPPDEALLLLARANVDKAVTGFPLERRLNLMARFAESRPTFSVAACSHGRFVDKAEAIRLTIPQEPGWPSSSASTPWSVCSIRNTTRTATPRSPPSSREASSSRRTARPIPPRPSQPFSPGPTSFPTPTGSA